MNERAVGVFDTSRVQLTEGRSLLLRFSLAGIPRRQRIVHSELTVPVYDSSGNEPRFTLWRMLAPWDAGVCHLYRTTRPKPLAWTRPGGRGLSSDRATRPTDVVRVAKAPTKINVTEDVLLWYERAAPNHGWMFAVDDPGVAVYMTSPLSGAAARSDWKLRITYEPR